MPQIQFEPPPPMPPPPPPAAQLAAPSAAEPPLGASLGQDPEAGAPQPLPSIVEPVSRLLLASASAAVLLLATVPRRGARNAASSLRRAAQVVHSVNYRIGQPQARRRELTMSWREVPPAVLPAAQLELQGQAALAVLFVMLKFRPLDLYTWIHYKRCHKTTFKQQQKQV